MAVTEFYHRSISPWHPVIVRGVLWIAIAVLSSMRHDLHDLTPEKMKIMTWVNWTDLAAGILLEGAISLRLFLDQSISKFGPVDPVIPIKPQ